MLNLSQEKSKTTIGRAHLSPLLDAPRTIKRRDYFLPTMTTTTTTMTMPMTMRMGMMTMLMTIRMREKDTFCRIKIFSQTLSLPLILSLAEITVQTCSGRLVRIDSFLWHFPPFLHNHSLTLHPPSLSPSWHPVDRKASSALGYSSAVTDDERVLLILCVETHNKNSTNLSTANQILCKDEKNSDLWISHKYIYMKILELIYVCVMRKSNIYSVSFAHNMSFDRFRIITPKYNGVE